MVISILDGSKVMESGVDLRVYTRLKELIHNESTAKVFFCTTSIFGFLCEWEIRKLQAAYPEKRIEVIRIEEDDSLECYFPAVEYTDFYIPPGEEVKKSGSLPKWMVDQSDYVLYYMDWLLTSSQMKMRSIQYACEKLPGCCFNFCTDEAMSLARSHIPALPIRERRALEGKLMGERKKSVANDLNVSVGTVRSYEIAGQHDVIKRTYQAAPANRTCAILEITSTQLLEQQVLYETVRYLMVSCRVGCFLISEETYQTDTKLASVLSQMGRCYADGISVKHMQAMCGDGGRAPTLTDNVLCYEWKSKGDMSCLRKERETMIDASDIVLCNMKKTRQSGLKYARKKHIPVINIAEI